MNVDMLTGEDAEFATRLWTVCTSAAWQRAVLAGAPYSSVEALLETSDEAVSALQPTDLLEALAGHPRIGERAEPAHGALAAAEQSGMASATEQLAQAMRDGNVAYEKKFDKVYLVCASGLSAEELYARLAARLDNDRTSEEQVTRSELAKINRLRLTKLAQG
ncbi:Putative oxo-4-hydroxy-4-carboxy-5-ureidoimidazoline decarboxylase [metagenome]|uniref:2-oxo-4-hydroxy-4-carboxy-5-ureidoimidazoline decarboxylase n=1 Tax=metagenome TaxID=256318 RepID=A0A2P2C419_9ZZZZ